MYAMFKGKPLSGPPGPQGPDGNPIGTIISYMGQTAPKDYLVCDGTVYSISDYSLLAKFLQDQFGSVNHFGGDGTTTFAVPDMRNLFLRGFHGAAEEHLSGEVGVRQEATKHIYNEIDTDATGLFGYPTENITMPVNMDSREGKLGYSGWKLGLYTVDDSTRKTYYTSRPVNMAVLYCIKAVESVPAENAYSTEETRIGTWIDGKPLYRMCAYHETLTIPYTSGMSGAVALTCPTDATVVSASSSGIAPDGGMRQHRHYIDVLSSENKVFLSQFWTKSNVVFSKVYVVAEYTKTTDQPPASKAKAPAKVTGSVTMNGQTYEYTVPAAPVTIASAASAVSIASTVSIASAVSIASVAAAVVAASAAATSLS